MATTSPDNLWSPDAADDYALTVDWAASMQTVQTALNTKVNATDTSSAIALNGGWSNVSGAGVATYRVKNGYASLNGRLATGTGATPAAFLLPVEARPSEARVHSVSVGGTSGVQAVIIQPDGIVRFPDMSIPTADYRLASIGVWPVA